MKTLIGFGLFLILFVLIIPVNADGKGELKKYFSNVASKVKATENTDEKRKILNESFQNMFDAMEKVESSWLISKEDRAGINQLKSNLQEKQNELAGINGYERVPDAQLNAFSQYVVQDMEQALSITISLLALVLIIILVVLLI
jgi:hypothetical protein